MDQMPLFGGPQGYVASASEAFRTVSEEKFSEVGTGFREVASCLWSKRDPL